MKFMLLMYSLPKEWPDAPQSDRDEVMEKHAGLRDELSASGELLSGAGLVDPSKTRTLRWNGGSPTRTDGPIAGADPPLTAYYVLECNTVERAI